MKYKHDPSLLESNAKIIFPFFLIHMLVFGSAGFYMAYADGVANILELYLFNSFAIYVYVRFYVVIFGMDSLVWIVINSLLGIYGIFTELDLILSAFGKHIDNYSYFIHAIPITYYILYTFLIRRALIYLTHSSDSKERTRRVEIGYVVFSFVLYTSINLV